MRRSRSINFALAGRPRGRGRRAFTFVELMLGMAVTILTLGAMAGLMTAVSSGWKYQGKAQVRYMGDRQAIVRVQNLFRGAKLIGTVREGSLASNTSDSAAVLFWKGDTSGGAADRTIEFSELGLLVHDRNSNSLKYYTVTYPGNISNAQYVAAEKTYTYADITTASAPDDFKALTYVGGQTIAKNVSGAAFYVTNATGQSSQSTTFEFQLAFTRDGTTAQVCGSAALRCPDYSVTN
jgi:hypothetical protein